MDEVERVTPAPGAPVVAFDYDAADAALDAIRAGRSRVVAGGDALDAMGDEAGVNWIGRHRDEFERARDAMKGAVETSIARLDSMRRTVLAVVDEANATQTHHNEQAQLPVGA
jgi:hypothetical protein